MRHSLTSTLVPKQIDLRDRLHPGTPVEVRRRFDRAWAKGFLVEGFGPGGIILRRASDDSILPLTFPAEDVRPATSQG